MTWVVWNEKAAARDGAYLRLQLNLFEQMQKKVPTGSKLDDITNVACFVE